MKKHLQKHQQKTFSTFLFSTFFQVLVIFKNKTRIDLSHYWWWLQSACNYSLDLAFSIDLLSERARSSTPVVWDNVKHVPEKIDMHHKLQSNK